MSTRRRLMMQSGEIPTIDDYIQNGLHLLLDSKTECSEQLWIDQIGRKQFIGNYITFIDGVPYFDNNYSVYYLKDKIGVNYDKGTLEVCMFSKTPSSYYCGVFGSRGFGGEIGMTTSGEFILPRGFDGGIAQMLSVGVNTIGSKTTISTTSNSLVVNYKSEIKGVFNNNFNGYANGYTTIGNMGINRTSNRRLVGSIYCIRVYNRKLSLEEMLHNQQIDNKRFHLGL